MPQIPDSEKLSRIRISLEAYDRGEIDSAMFADHVRWALDQEAVSDADVELAAEEARTIRPMIEAERLNALTGTTPMQEHEEWDALRSLAFYHAKQAAERGG